MGILKRLNVRAAGVPHLPNRFFQDKTSLLFIVAMIFAQARPSCSLNDSPLTIEVERSVFPVNATLLLSCTLTQPSLATANATDITWTRDGKAITKANARVEAVGSSVASRLIVDKVQFDDKGVYACRLGDGSPSSTVNIQVGLPPAKARNLGCHSHNYKTIQCSWTNGPDTHLNTTHQLIWRDHDEKPTTCNVTMCSIPHVVLGYEEVLTACNATTCTFPEVDEADFVVKSSNALGTTTSDELIFKEKEVVLHPPRLTAVTAVSESALRIDWQPPDDYWDYPTHIRLDLSYRLHCKYMDSNSSWRPCSLSAMVVPITKEPFAPMNFTHLSRNYNDLPQPYGWYQISVRVKAPIASYWSDPSKNISVRTSEAAPQSGVSLGLHCTTDVNKQRDVQLSWQPLPEYKMNGKALYYVINVNGTLSNVSGNSSRFLKRGLNPYKHYYISIVGHNSVGATDEDSCDITAMPAVIESFTPLVAGIIVATLFFISCIIGLVCAWQRVKKSMIHIPDIKLPNYIQADNFYTHEGPHRGLNHEKEIYDELINPTLFVDLTPESDSCAPSCNGVITNGFVVDKDLSKEPILEPLENQRKHPLLSARRTNSLVNENYSQAPTEQESLLGDDPFLPEAEPDRCKEPSGDYSHHYGGWKDSALSIRSGGSYMNLRENDPASYSDMTDGGLTSISEDGHRVVMDGLGDAQEARSGLMPHSLEQLPRDDPECAYTFMGMGKIGGGSENLSQHPGCLENNGPGTSIDTSRDQPCRNIPGGQRGPAGRTKPLCDSHPCSADDEILEAAQDDPCNALGNYVQQGMFLSPSPKLPSSRSWSPRPNPYGRRTPRPLESRSTTQTTGGSNPSGRKPGQCLPGQLQVQSPPNQTVEGPSLLDSPDSSQDDIQPYVLNSCVLSGSAEPLLINPHPDGASPRLRCDSHPNQLSDCSSSTSLSNGDSLGESTPLMLNDSDVSECSSPSDEEGGPNYVAVAGSQPNTGSSTANGRGGYITMGQLPPPSPAGVVNGDSRGDRCANTILGGNSYVTPDRLLSLTKASDAAFSGAGPQDSSYSGEMDSKMGSCVGPGEIAKVAVSKSTNTQHNGLRNDAPHCKDSDYVTEAQMRKLTKDTP